jgi:hypothetical protein
MGIHMIKALIHSLVINSFDHSRAFVQKGTCLCGCNKSKCKCRCASSKSFKHEPIIDTKLCILQFAHITVKRTVPLKDHYYHSKFVNFQFPLIMANRFSSLLGISLQGHMFMNKKNT